MTEALPSTPTGNEPGAANQQQSTTPRTYTQDDYNALDAKLRREYEAKTLELRKKADEWDKQQEASKTEIQREREAKAKAEAELASLKLQIDLQKWRSKAGKKHSIPEADWNRLRGSTESEIEDDARAWAKSRGLDKAGGATPLGGNPPTRNPFNQAFLDATGRGGR